MEHIMSRERKMNRMSDTISRQAAIAYAISGKTREFDGDKWIRVSEVRESLKTMPSAEPERPSEIQDILDYLDTALHPIISPEYWNVYSELHDMISTLSSTQTEIIRCKDCKYAKLTHDGSCKYCDIWFPDEAEYMDENYYCASAERKTNE